jgi:hypothetical protein
MKYIINNERAREIFIQIDNNLDSIKVSGGDVEKMYVARRLLKEQLFSNLQELPDEVRKEG